MAGFTQDSVDRCFFILSCSKQNYKEPAMGKRRNVEDSIRRERGQVIVSSHLWNWSLIFILRYEDLTEGFMLDRQVFYWTLYLHYLFTSLIYLFTGRALLTKLLRVVLLFQPSKWLRITGTQPRQTWPTHVCQVPTICQELYWILEILWWNFYLTYILYRKNRSIKKWNPY